MKIWAHRGCSQNYPENTITSFKKACEIPGLTGIELDVQRTRDGKLVVIHDETVDRTTNASGFVRDFTVDQLKKMDIETGMDYVEHIPTLDEVLDTIEYRLREGMLLNIELKTSVYDYPGIEREVVAAVEARGLQDSIVYSSFSAKSLVMLHMNAPYAKIGMLDCKISDCLIKTYGLESVFTAMDMEDGAEDMLCGDIALHPHWRDIDYDPMAFEGRTVRAFFGGHLFPEKPTGTRLDFASLEKIGITDVFINEPEVYLL